MAMRPPTKRNKPRHIEDLEQQALFNWANLYKLSSGEYLSDYLFAIPNGGNRNAREAARLKGQGVKAGVSDMFLPIPSNGSHGLWIELKAPRKYRSSVSDSQDIWLKRMVLSGYESVVAYGWLEAKHLILEYLRQDPFIQPIGRYQSDR